jgi:hypothetical protein
MTADLSRTLRRGQEHAVFDRMRPWLTEALRRNDGWPVLTLAWSLGRRAWDIPGLQELLGRAAKLKNDHVIDRAVALWLRPPRGRDDKVAALVARDESYITLHQVRSVAVRRSSELVDRYVLAGRKLRGRFGTGKAVWVPVLARADLSTWVPGQVDRYAELLARAGADKGLDRWRRAAFVRTLAALPAAMPARVAELIGGDDVLIAEAALAGLAHGDRPDLALPVLLANVQGDRARVAMFAASRCARDIAPSTLAGMLRQALTGETKVTVRKEAARLLSLLRPPGAVDELLAAWHRDGQHRDVLVAVAAAMRAHLDDPRSWPVLEAAAGGERHAAETLLDAIPYRLPERHRHRYAQLVRRLVGHPETDVVRRAYAALAGWVRWAPEIASELIGGVSDLSAGSTWRYALSCAETPTVWSSLPDLLPELTSTLLRLTRSDPDAEALRDLPARQRLLQLVGGVCRSAQVGRRHPEPVRRMVEILGADPTFVPAAGGLAASLLWPGTGFVPEVQALADLLSGFAPAVSEVDDWLAVAEWEPDDVGPAVDALTARGDAAGGRLAVMLAGTAGSRAGWPEAWRQRLRVLRGHQAPEVRYAALGVFTATE